MKAITTVLLCLLALHTFGQQDFEYAQKLVNSEQYEAAEEVFASLLEKDPTNGDLYYYYGEALLKDYLSDTLANSLEEFASSAEELFQEGLKRDPGNPLNLIGMGAVILLRTSDTIQAQPYFDKAEVTIPTRKRQITPKHAVLLEKMAEAQLYSKIINYSRVIYYTNKAREIDPENPYIYLTLGNMYIAQNNASDALFNYNRANYYDPEWPVPKIKIGDIYMRIPNIQVARPYFEDARDIDSTFAPVYRSLGELYYKAGMYDLSNQMFERFMMLSGYTTPSKLQYANSLFKAGDYAGALEVYEDILEVDQSRNYLYRVAAYSCYEVRPQQLEKGLKYIETFLQNEDPENIIARDYAYYGRILYRMADYSDSVLLARSFTQFMNAYELDSANVNLVSELALDFYNGKWYEGAIRMYQRKAELRDGEESFEDIMRIGRSYYNLKMTAEADSVFSKCVGLQPDNIEAHMFLARTYTLMDPNTVKGLAAPKFQTVIDRFSPDAEQYKNQLYEAFSYMEYYNLQQRNYSAVRSWADRIMNLDPQNRDWQINALSAKAISYYHVDDYVNSREMYQQLLNWNPENAAEIRRTIEDLTKLINMERNLRQ
ncbi:MAG: tetratricopeptide repeat protein [Bacteroidales bacterium]|nr:tetratricopeptide repeat protein [Bacteroidales bacterium]